MGHTRRRGRCLTSAGALLLLLAAATPSIATTRFVDCDNTSGAEDGSLLRPFRTIRAALNNSLIGDEVLVAGGCTYDENITISEGVRVVGVADPNGARPIIDGGFRSNAVVIVALDPGTTLSGFVVTGGRGLNGGGIFASGNARITGNLITGNRAYGFTFGGGAARGGGIFISGNAVVEDNEIRDNVVVGGDGGGIATTTGSPNITRNLIVGNRALVAPDGIYGYGGGISIHRSSGPSVTSNIIAGNRAEQGGGGIDVYVTPSGIAGNTIAGNAAGIPGRKVGHGGGVQIGGSTGSGIDSVVINNLILYNSATVDGGGADVIFSSPVFRSNSFFGNTINHVSGVTALVGTGGNAAVDPNLGIDPARPIDPADLVPGPAFPHTDVGLNGRFCFKEDPNCPSPDGGDPVITVRLGDFDQALHPRQLDGNGDGIGRPDLGALERLPGLNPLDADGDGVLDATDNCPTVSNAGRRTPTSIPTESATRSATPATTARRTSTFCSSISISMASATTATRTRTTTRSRRTPTATRTPSSSVWARPRCRATTTAFSSSTARRSMPIVTASATPATTAAWSTTPARKTATRTASAPRVTTARMSPTATASSTRGSAAFPPTSTPIPSRCRRRTSASSPTPTRTASAMPARSTSTRTASTRISTTTPTRSLPVRGAP